MGKIRVTTLGDERTEKAQKQDAQKRREAKKEQKVTKLQGKGGGRIVDASLDASSAPKIETEEQIKASVRKEPKAPRYRGKKFRKSLALVEKGKLYPISQAIELVKKTSYSKFIGSIEMHINVKEKGLRGTVSLPHGTGKQIRVVVADEAIIEKIQSGKIDFDILVSAPQMMPKLAKVARILGPKGLMPNPKAGTISQNPEEVAKKLSSGQMQWKTETEAPIVHIMIGKADFEDKKLSDNFEALIKAIGPEKINSVFIKATMSPSVKVRLTQGN